MNLPPVVCNFCDAEYDRFEGHTCAGNSVIPTASRIAELINQQNTSICVSTMNDIGSVFCTICNRQFSAKEWETHTDHKAGLTRQQIGEALDKYRQGALGTQTGGDHYRKLAIQPVEYIIANGIGFLAGNIVKYATRYKDKGGAEDIRKIKHYCDLILEFEYKEE